MRVAIFGNTQKPILKTELSHLLDYLEKHEVQIFLANEIRNEFNLRNYPTFCVEEYEKGSIDFALSVGGDGTFLTTTAIIEDTNIPILGINVGYLGFLADAKFDNIDVIIDQLIAGKYFIEQRKLLTFNCSSNTRTLSSKALNEIAILKQGLSSMIAVETYLDDYYLTTYNADGLIISTPTGSTAYNLSVGGPIIHPHMKAIILSPIAPHNLSIRPFVIPDTTQLTLKVKSRNGSFMVSVDGRCQVINETETIHIETAPHSVNLVQFDNYNFIKSIKNKLGWG